MREEGIDGGEVIGALYLEYDWGRYAQSMVTTQGKLRQNNRKGDRFLLLDKNNNIVGSSSGDPFGTHYPLLKGDETRGSFVSGGKSISYARGEIENGYGGLELCSVIERETRSDEEILTVLGLGEKSDGVKPARRGKAA